MRWQTKKLIFSVVIFLLSWAIDSWCLLSSDRIHLSSPSLSSSLSFGTGPRIKDSGCVFLKERRNLLDHRTRNCSPMTKTKTTTIKASNDDDDDQNFDFNKENNNSNNEKDVKGKVFSKVSDGDEINYFSLEKVTRDLLNTNITVAGKWTKQDLRRLKKVVNIWSHRAASVPAERSSGTAPAVQQERLLRRVIEEKLTGNIYALEFNMTDIYSDIILSWSRSQRAGGRYRAEEILMEMQNAYNSGEHDGEDLKPTISSWNAVLNAYALSKSKDAPNHAMRVISTLYQLILDGKTDATPNHESYVSVLKAFANVGGPDAPKRTLELLTRMQKLKEGGFSLDVTTNCHNVYLASLIESMKDERVSSSKTALLADSHLRKMMEDPNPMAKPDRRSYNIVLSGWSKSGDHDLGRKAEILVKEMEASLEGDSVRIAPNAYTYNCLISCYTWSRFPDKGEKALSVLDKMKGIAEVNHYCRPDSTTYNSVMNCITKSNDKSAPFKVEALLEEMNTIFKRTGDPSIKPTNRSFNACVDAWARSTYREAPQRVMNWINRLQDDFESGRTDTMPNKWTYNSYIFALSKQKIPSSADEAEKILNMMEDKSRQFGSSNLKPDVLTYTNVLHCIALSESDDAFKRALAILSKMEEGDGDVRPNVYTYNVLINVVAKSKLPGKAKIAVQLMNRMKEVAIRPITITYNNALNACAYSNREIDDREEVLALSLMVLQEAQKTCEGANYITYSTYLRVVRFFVYDHLERWRLIRNTFRRCCEDGQLTPDIMKQIKSSLSSQQYQLLVQEGTDKKTGRWQEKYTANAKRLKNQPLRRHKSVRFR